MADTNIGTATVGIKLDDAQLKSQLGQIGRDMSGYAGGGLAAGGVKMGDVIGGGIIAGIVSRLKSVTGSIEGLGVTLADKIGGKLATRIENLPYGRGKAFTFEGAFPGLRESLTFGLAGPLVNTAARIEKIIGLIAKFPVEAGLIAVTTIAVSKMVMAFANLENQVGRTSRLFRESTKDANAWIRAMVDGTGLSEVGIRGAANQIQAALAPILHDRALSASMARRLTGRAIDMAEDNGGSPAGASEAIAQALKTGSGRSFGIHEAEIEAKALEMTHVGIAEQLTRQAKTLALIELIMQRTSDYSGAFSARSVEVETQWSRLKGSLGNVLTNFGGIISNLLLLPVIMRDIADTLSYINMGWRELVGLTSYWLKLMSMIPSPLKIAKEGVRAYSAAFRGDIGSWMAEMKKEFNDLWNGTESADPLAGLKDNLEAAAKAVAQVVDGIASINRMAQESVLLSPIPVTPSMPGGFGSQGPTGSMADAGAQNWAWELLHQTKRIAESNQDMSRQGSAIFVR